MEPAKVTVLGLPTVINLTSIRSVGKNVIPIPVIDTVVGEVSNNVTAIGVATPFLKTINWILFPKGMTPE